ncbi:MAG TPA: hypothetical protein PK095_21300 [Myxococcota bacterium]|nr:hypothetical protein [Myxococcota bacterium]
MTSDHGLDALLEIHGFERLGAARLKHASGATVDLLIAGSPSPRSGEAPYPRPQDLVPSALDRDVVGLAGLVALKLSARRAQDRADLVALMKPLSEGAYLEIEASLPPGKRRALRELREEALEELAMERAQQG